MTCESHTPSPAIPLERTTLRTRNIHYGRKKRIVDFLVEEVGVEPEQVRRASDPGLSFIAVNNAIKATLHWVRGDNIILCNPLSSQCARTGVVVVVASKDA